MQKDITYRFIGSEESFRSGDAFPVGESAGRFDIDRMKKALASETVKAPTGLSIEEMRQFILAHVSR